MNRSNNLLVETVAKLPEYGKTPDHVIWCGSRDGRLALDWEHFAIVADVTYDNDFGGQ